MRKLFFLVACCCVPFLFYLFRTDLLFYDSYFFFNTGVVSNQTFLANFFLNLIPKNLLFIKFLQFFSLVFCVITLSLTGNVLNKKYGWLAGFFGLCLAPALIMEFFKFENEFLAFPFLFLGTYFFVRGTFERRQFNFCVVASLVCLVVAGLFWQLVAFYVVVLCLYSVLFLLLGVPIFVFYINRFVENVLPNNTIAERTLFAGVLPVFLLLVGVGSVFVGFPYPFLLLVFVLLSVLNAKLVIFCVVWLSLGLVWFVAKMKGEYDFKVKRVLLIGIFLLFLISFNILGSEPTANQVAGVKDVVMLSNGKLICNDWDLGYWVKYWGGYTLQDGNSYVEVDCNGLYYLTKRVKADCVLVNDYEDVFVYLC